jgi:hypothetical protein
VRIERYSRSAYWTLFQKCVLNVIPEVRIERYSRSAYWTLFQKCVLHKIRTSGISSINIKHKLMMCSDLRQTYKQTPLRRGALDVALSDKVCQWLVTVRWFSPRTPVSSTNKTDHHDIAEILVKVVLTTTTLTLSHKSLDIKFSNINSCCTCFTLFLAHHDFMFDIYWTYSISAYWTLFQKCVLNVIPEVRIERYSRSAYWTLFQKCVLNVIPEVRIAH